MLYTINDTCTIWAIAGKLLLLHAQVGLNGTDVPRPALLPIQVVVGSTTYMLSYHNPLTNWSQNVVL